MSSFPLITCMAFRKQQGVTLVIGLIVLLLLTLIGVSAMKNSTMQQKISGNMRDMEISFQASEVSLRQAETWLNTLTSRPLATANCTGNGCVAIYNAGLYLESQNNAWWLANGATSTDAVQTVSAQPLFYIQEVGFVPDSLVIGSGTTPGRYYYYITSYAKGSSSDTTSVLQSTYTRRY